MAGKSGETSQSGARLCGVGFRYQNETREVAVAVSAPVLRHCRLFVLSLSAVRRSDGKARTSRDRARYSSHCAQDARQCADRSTAIWGMKASILYF